MLADRTGEEPPEVPSPSDGPPRPYCPAPYCFYCLRPLREWETQVAEDRPCCDSCFEDGLWVY